MEVAVVVKVSHAVEKSGELARATSYEVAPACAGHEYSFVAAGLWNPDTF